MSVRKTKHKISFTGGIILASALISVTLGWHCAEKVEHLPDFGKKESFFFPELKIQQTYPFLRLDKNQLQFPSDSATYNSVYAQLDQILFDGKGHLSILHMGGSHVQAGAVGHRMRELVDGLAWGLTEERGLLFPFRVAQTNSTIYTSSEYTGEWEGCRCAHSKNECNWGMSGIAAVSSSDSATFKTWAFKTDSTLYRSTSVSLFYDMSLPHFEPIWNGLSAFDSLRVDSASSSQTWYFTMAVDTLAWKFIKRDSLAMNISIQGVLPQNDQARITYHEIGVNGASTSSYLRCDEMENQLKAISPDLVIFGIGINDAHVPESSFSKEDFMARYDELIRRCKTSNPNVTFLFLTNNDSYYRRRRPNPNGKVVQEAMYELAEKHKGAVWDLFEIMGGYKSIVLWDDYGLAKNDRIHFTRKGYFLQAELMYDALMKDYGYYLTKEKEIKAQVESKEDIRR
jgi:lysophospholipase L1-like esterase